MRLSVFLLAIAAFVPTFATAIDVPNGKCRFPFEIPVVVNSSRLVFLGELHGTNEAPALAAEFACELARRDHGVTLALEISSTEQPQIDHYLASAGSIADQSKLISTEFWQVPNDRQDGRHSLAVLALLERVRQLRAANVEIEVLAFDGWRAGASRDAIMAENLRVSMRQHPRASFLILVGNVHASKSKGALWDSLYEPMAYLLSSEEPLSLLIDSSVGTAWVCMGEQGCGVHNIGGSAQSPIGFAIGKSRMPGYDGSVVLKSISASLPAGSSDCCREK